MLTLSSGAGALRVDHLLASEAAVLPRLRSDHPIADDRVSARKRGHAGMHCQPCGLQECLDGATISAGSTCQAALYKQAANALTSILAHAEAIKRHALSQNPSKEEVAFSSIRIAAEAKRAWAAMIGLGRIDHPGVGIDPA